MKEVISERIAVYLRPDGTWGMEVDGEEVTSVASTRDQAIHYAESVMYETDHYTKCSKFDWDTQQTCGEPGEMRFDRYSIAAGTMCDKHWEASHTRTWVFDPSDAGEALEPGDY